MKNRSKEVGEDSQEDRAQVNRKKPVVLFVVGRNIYMSKICIVLCGFTFLKIYSCAYSF